MSSAWSITTIAQWLGVNQTFEDTMIESFAIDSRTLSKGALFFAIQGEKFDGHDFVAAAIAQGAVAIVASKPLDVAVPVIVVKDTTQALGQVATAIRLQYSPKTVAITGSCGKTTTKAMVASILQLAGKTLVPEKNYNNQWGLPLTLFHLEATHQFAVLELGADHVGEIAQLTAIAKPDVAILTCAQPVHVEKFGSLENIAQGKGEIFQGLPAKGGVAIINADDDFATYWRGLIPTSQRIIAFGFDDKADVYATDITLDESMQPHFTLVYGDQKLPISLKVMGKHNIANALASASACLALGIPAKMIQQGLENMQPVAGRLVRKQGLNGATLIDDTYNANPHALDAALAVLAGNLKQKILVLGDMLELGADALQWHYKAGQMARAAGVTHLYAYGPLSEEAVKAFGEGGLHFQTHETLIESLKKDLNHETAVLFKASRGMKLEKIVDAVVIEAGR